MDLCAISVRIPPDHDVPSLFPLGTVFKRYVSKECDIMGVENLNAVSTTSSCGKVFPKNPMSSQMTINATINTSKPSCVSWADECCSLSLHVDNRLITERIRDYINRNNLHSSEIVSRDSVEEGSMSFNDMIMSDEGDALALSAETSFITKSDLVSDSEIFKFLNREVLQENLQLKALLKKLESLIRVKDLEIDNLNDQLTMIMTRKDQEIDSLKNDLQRLSGSSDKVSAMLFGQRSFGNLNGLGFKNKHEGSNHASRGVLKVDHHNRRETLSKCLFCGGEDHVQSTCWRFKLKNKRISKIRSDSHTLKLDDQGSGKNNSSKHRRRKKVACNNLDDLSERLAHLVSL